MKSPQNAIKRVRLLMLEDDPCDEELILRELRKCGINHDAKCVSNKGEFLSALVEFGPDVVLSDYKLDGFDGMAALTIVREERPNLPFILVTGALGEELAVETIKRGATDYILKDRLSTLVPALLRAIREAEVRTQCRLAEELVQHQNQQLRLQNENLLESEERFRQLAENIREVFWITDPHKAQVIYISPTYESIWGQSCKSLYASPRKWIEALHPDDRARVEDAAFTKQILGEYDEVYRIVRPDNSYRWIHDRAFPIRNDSGEVYRIVGIAEDVSERKRFEESLRESEARKNAILQSALDGIVTIDHLGHIADFNNGAEKIFDCARAQVLGKEMALVIIPTASRRWFQLGFAELFAANKGPLSGGRIEMIGLRADGAEFPIEFTITRIELEGPPMFTAFIRDISSRRQAEEQLHLLANAMQSTQELISITDAENRLTFVNRAFLAAYGYIESTISGKKPDFLYPRNVPGFCEQIFQRKGVGEWQGEVVSRRKDGTEFPISLSTSQIKMASGKLLGFVAVARDVSDRKRAEKENTAFSQLGYRLNSATTPAEAANIILDIASELFGWDAGYVHLCSSAQDKIIPVLTIDTLNGERTRIPPTTFTHDPSPLMRAIMKQGARLINQAAESKLSTKLVPFGDTARPSASMMYVPIHSADTVLGILSIQSYKFRAYSEGDLHLLQTLADHCGNALRRIEVSEALRGAEAQYRSIFENATEGVFQITPQGRYRSANPALARMLGYQTPEDLISSGTDIGRQTYVLPEKWEELKRILETKDSVCEFEVERLRKDGTKIWLSINAHTVRGGDGAILYYEGTNQNITARKKAEAVLRESEERFRALFESAPIGIALHDSGGKYIHINRAYHEMLGYSIDELKRLGVKRVTCSEDVTEGQRFFGELRQGSRDYYRREKRYLRKDGSQVWAESSASAVRDNSGRLCYIISMVEDITARKQAEEELRLLPQRIIEAQENERLRVARELHDGVNQLIASVKMRLHRVETQIANERPAASEILARCSQLLVQALAENRRIAYDLRPGDLDELGLAVACKHFCEEFQSRTTLRVKSQVPRSWSPLPSATELNLFRIVQEALTNVQKHAHAKTVWLRLTAKGDFVLLRIRDDGRGREANAAKPSRKRKSGLGLTNMRERTASVGGTFEVVSEPKQGTTITVRVPRTNAK